MAHPELSDGYTKIANELLEATFRYITNPTWLRITLATIRITYGWRMKERESNVSSYAKMLNLTDEYVKTSLTEMEQTKIVNIVWISPRKFTISINKNYDKWSVRH